jgi:hypothetical protein
MKRHFSSLSSRLNKAALAPDRNRHALETPVESSCDTFVSFFSFFNFFSFSRSASKSSEVQQTLLLNIPKVNYLTKCNFEFGAAQPSKLCKARCCNAARVGNSIAWLKRTRAASIPHVRILGK